MGWPAPALRRSWCYLACPRPSINVRLEQLARDGPEPMEDVASAAAQVGSGDVEAKATVSTEVVFVMSRLGGAHTAERQIVRPT